MHPDQIPFPRNDKKNGPPQPPKFSIPDKIEISKIDDLKAGDTLEMSDGSEYERQTDGSLKKTGQAEVKGFSWQRRAIRAEKAFVAMVEERKKIQNLILEACLKLEGYGFECIAGSLNNCEEFLQIKAFARGVPRITRPPLEGMSLDGKRAVKAIHVSKEEYATEYFLECGHAIKIPNADAKHDKFRYKVNDVVQCGECTILLRARGMYEKTD